VGIVLVLATRLGHVSLDQFLAAGVRPVSFDQFLAIGVRPVSLWPLVTWGNLGVWSCLDIV
jgi:hypothetical protein